MKRSNRGRRKYSKCTKAMKPTETSIVIVSDSGSESETNEDTKVFTIDETDTTITESEVEVITLDDSNTTANNSNVTFKIDVTPDFIPIDVSVKYNKPRRTFRKRRLDSSPEVTVLKMRKRLTEDQISFTKNTAVNKKCKFKRKPRVNLCKTRMIRCEQQSVEVITDNTKKSQGESESKSDSQPESKFEGGVRKPKVPPIQLSHTNILNTMKTPRLSKGLRPIIIDGCNVAFGFGNGEFLFQGIIFVVQYFQKRGHDEIVCFLPQNYRNKSRPLDINKVLKRYEKENIIVYTPSRFLNGKLIKPYDDRFIVQYASEREGVIISNDGYLDLINEESSWRTTIEQRIVNFTFARGLLMLPKDPLGPDGPTLDEMLKFP